MEICLHLFSCLFMQHLDYKYVVLSFCGWEEFLFSRVSAEQEQLSVLYTSITDFYQDQQSLDLIFSSHSYTSYRVRTSFIYNFIQFYECQLLCLLVFLSHHTVQPPTCSLVKVFTIPLMEHKLIISTVYGAYSIISGNLS